MLWMVPISPTSSPAQVPTQSRRLLQLAWFAYERCADDVLIYTGKRPHSPWKNDPSTRVAGAACRTQGLPQQQNGRTRPSGETLLGGQALRGADAAGIGGSPGLEEKPRICRNPQASGLHPQFKEAPLGEDQKAQGEARKWPSTCSVLWW